MKSIMISGNLHSRLKVICVNNGIGISELTEKAIEAALPQYTAENAEKRDTLAVLVDCTDYDPAAIRDEIYEEVARLYCLENPRGDPWKLSVEFVREMFYGNKKRGKRT